MELRGLETATGGVFLQENHVYNLCKQAKRPFLLNRSHCHVHMSISAVTFFGLGGGCIRQILAWSKVMYSGMLQNQGAKPAIPLQMF